MKTQQQFYILKLSSSRIRNFNYKIELDINQARQNGELVSIAQNQAIFSLFDLQGRTFDQNHINELFDLKRKIKNRRSSSENIKQLKDVEKEIDSILFIPELISVLMDKKSHYLGIIKNSFFVNNHKYVRLLCSAGQARRNRVTFIQEEYEKSLKYILSNGHKEIEMPIAKYNAYFSLSYSGIFPVSEPYFCVIPDYEIKRKERVDFIEENERGDYQVKEIEKELDFNVFDGQGLISPRLANLWAKEIGIDDYTPSAFIIRCSFLKGMVCTFDFKKYTEEVGIHHTTDVWGNDVNLWDVDLVITASQFKMWTAYSSCQDYIKNCRANKMLWGITRCTPKEDNKFVFSNYQFIQSLSLDDNQIKSLCQGTIDYFRKVIKNDVRYTLLYLLGEISNKGFDNNVLDKTKDNITKALILNNELINDSYIKTHIIRSLNKKIKESYIGSLLLNGNYTMLVIDPVAFVEHMLGLPVKGLLGKKEYYCDFWNKKGIHQVAAMRAPLTWVSEVNVLNMINNGYTEEWYQYLRNGVVVYGIHGHDMMLHSDSDADGDILMLTDQKEFIEGAQGGLPIAYEKKKAPKEVIKEDELYKTDLLSFDSKIGWITNNSTSLYSQALLYEKDSKEYAEIINRLKICRRAQGDQIDLAKGIDVRPFPKWWTQYTKISGSPSPEELEKINFDNKLIIDKRVYFMRWLYSNYNHKFTDYNSQFNKYAYIVFNKKLIQILETYKTDIDKCSQEELDFVKSYYKYNYLLDTPCVMNNVCHLLEQEIKEIKTNSTLFTLDRNVYLLKNHDIEFDTEKYKKLYDLYCKYKNGKRNFEKIKDEYGEDRFKSLEQYNKSVREEAELISSDILELANLAVTICYERNKWDSKDFAWTVFGDGILLNVMANRQDKISVPFIDSNGDIDYLGGKYKMFEIQLENPDNAEIYEENIL